MQLTRNITSFIAGTVLSVFSVSAMAISPLVDGNWVLENLDAENIIFLDIQNPPQYQQYHIPGAVNAPFGQWRANSEKGLRGMLPPMDQLEKQVGALGIGNDSTVVIVGMGRSAGDMSAAARVFWTFKVMGHKEVAVLNGGLVGYAQAAGGKPPLKSGIEKNDPATYTAKIDQTLVATADSTLAVLEDDVELIDARSGGEFAGVYRGGEKERPGTIPGAKNLPFDWLTVNGSGTLRDQNQIDTLFASADLGKEGEQIHFCHTGNRASLTWFVAYALFGNEKAKLYDGSMLEWSADDKLPIEQKIKL